MPPKTIETTKQRYCTAGANTVPKMKKKHIHSARWAGASPDRQPPPPFPPTQHRSPISSPPRSTLAGRPSAKEVQCRRSNPRCILCRATLYAICPPLFTFIMQQLRHHHRLLYGLLAMAACRACWIMADGVFVRTSSPGFRERLFSAVRHADLPLIARLPT